MKQQTHVLLTDCPDQKGLIYAVCGVLLKHNMNIISNREFVDTERKYFYMRTEFEGLLKDKAVLLNDLKESLPENTNLKIPKTGKKSIVIFASKEHHCLSELLLRNEHHELKAEIKAVISNHSQLKDLVEKFKIPFHHISNKDEEREAHEEEILKTLKKYNPNYLVLAKYMRILSPQFIAKYENRIINIHHSFLPAFIGANPYQQAYKRGVKIIGATAHFATSELDQGPIITQNVTPINHTFTPLAMQQAGRNVEKITLVKALDLVFDDRVFLNGNKTIVFDQN